MLVDVVVFRFESVSSLLNPDGLRWRPRPFQMVVRIVALGSSGCLTKIPTILSLSARKPEAHEKAPMGSPRQTPLSDPSAQVFNMCVMKAPDDSESAPGTTVPQMKL